MSYLALARKWRPKKFDEVMGQAHVVQALSNALETGRVHHAFLFTGTRGVGKTTLARIFSKSLNCEQGMSASPCGQCSICKGVDQGSFIDLIEVDAASRTGIDDMRELLDNVQYAPTQGRYKVYLIDEIHMLSKSSFNALLKTLEEPPEHVKFLFATTDPQKLPVTVLSRCLQFNLKALQPNQIHEQLQLILTAEDIDFDDLGIQLLSRAADGSLRDALSLLEQAIAQGGGAVKVDSVRTMLGTVKSNHMDELLQSILSSDVESALSTIQSMASYAADFNAAIDQLLIEFHNIALAQSAPQSLAHKISDVEKYLSYAEMVTREDIQLCYQITLIAKRDISLAPDYQSGFEMAVLRIIAFKPVNNLTQTQDKRAVEENLRVNPSNNIKKVVTSEVELKEPSSEVEKNGLKEVDHKKGDSATKVSHSEVKIDNYDVDVKVDGRADPEAPTGNISYQHSNQQNDTGNIRHEPKKPQLHEANSILDNHAELNSAPKLPNSKSNAQGNLHNFEGTASEPTVFTSTEIKSNASDELTEIEKKIPPASPSEWAGFVEQLQLNGLVRELALNLSCLDINQNPMRLSLNPDFAYLKNDSREAVIADEIRKLRGANYEILIVLEATMQESPAERIKRLTEELQHNTVQEVKGNSSVQTFAQAFDLSIEQSKIKPK